MKRVIIVHGWGGTPLEGWFLWLKRELETRVFEVVVPQLPHTNHPKIENWVPALAAAVGAADSDTYFVGHSLGCETIARYLDGLEHDVTVGGVVYVAGFFESLCNIEDESVWHAWRDAPINLSRVRSRSPRSIAIFSDDDMYVPLSNQNDFREQLGSEIRVMHGMNHFNEAGGFHELPIVLESVLTLAQ